MGNSQSIGHLSKKFVRGMRNRMMIKESSRIALKLSTCGRWREGAKKEGEIEPLRREDSGNGPALERKRNR